MVVAFSFLSFWMQRHIPEIVRVLSHCVAAFKDTAPWDKMLREAGHTVRASRSGGIGVCSSPRFVVYLVAGSSLEILLHGGVETDKVDLNEDLVWL